MDDDLESADNDPLSTCSVSSLLPHCSSEELIEKNEELQLGDVETKIKNGRARKLLQKYNLLIPELKVENVPEQAKVDLAVPGDSLDPWLTKRFPAIKKRNRPLICFSDKPRDSVSAQRRVQQDLLAKLAVKRKVDQERRKELYAEDNEDILAMNDDEDDEVRLKQKTGSKPVKSDSEDDEDYTVEDSKDEDEEVDSDKDSEGDNNKSSDYDENYPRASLKESVDIFDTQSPVNHVELGTQPNIFPVTDSNPQVLGVSQFPSSLSQWCFSESEKHRNSQEPASDEDIVEELNNSVVKDPINNEDLLIFCSGQFDIPAPVTVTNPPVEEDSDESEVKIHKDRKKKKKRIIDSDDEYDQEELTTIDNAIPDDTTTSSQDLLKPRKAVIVSDDEYDQEELTTIDNAIPDDTTTSSQDLLKPRKAVIVSDDEDETSGVQVSDVIESDTEEPVEEAVDEEEEIEDNAGEGDQENGSDDELAVIRRLENQEYRRKLKKRKFFDDEASLSGSDVGSDLDEDEDGNDEYEADDCDNEEFDQEDLRNKNHKLFLKQQQQQVHREIAKLQDRLLADGDLSGVETNRSFRVRLREDAEIDMAVLNDQSQESPLDEENPEEEKKRADAIRFKAEMHSVLSQAQDEPIEDDIERAARAANLAESDNSIEHQSAPTLIGKIPLANIFKDINGSTSARQMYKTTTDSLTGKNKRPSEALLGEAKKQKITLFDALDD